MGSGLKAPGTHSRRATARADAARGVGARRFEGRVGAGAGAPGRHRSGEGCSRGPDIGSGVAGLDAGDVA